MSLGATTSAPARAWETAVRASSSSDASLSTLPSAVSTPAVAVVGVLAEADVGEDEQLGVRRLDRARGELDRAVVVPGAGAVGVLLGGDAEEQDGRDAERVGGAGLLHDRGDAVAVDAGHRGDRRAPLQPVLDEQRQHEVRRRQRGLAHEVAQRAGAAQAAQAGGGKGGGHAPQA